MATSLSAAYLEQLELLLVPSEWSSLSVPDYQQKVADATDLIDQLAVINDPTVLRQYLQRLQECKRHYLLCPTASTSVTNTQSAEHGLALLKQAQRELQESEDSGKDTLNHLDQQTARIRSTHNNVRTINQKLSYSDRLLNKMNQWFR